MFECTHLLELCLYLLESSIVVMIIRNVNILVQGLVYTCLKTCMYTCVQPTHQLEHTHTLSLSLCLSVSLYIFTLYYICTHCTMIGHDDDSWCNACIAGSLTVDVVYGCSSYSHGIKYSDWFVSIGYSVTYYWSVCLAKMLTSFYYHHSLSLSLNVSIYSVCVCSICDHIEIWDRNTR